MDRQKIVRFDDLRAPASTGKVPWHLIPPVALAVFLGLGLLQSLGALGRAVAIFVLGVTVANALAPPVSFLSRYIPRPAAALLVFASVVCIAALVGYLLFPALASESAQIVEDIPEHVDALRDRINAFLPGANIADRLSAVSSRIAEYVISLGTQIASLAFAAILILFLAVYWLLGMPSIGRAVESLFPPDRAQHVSRVAGKMGRAMGGYVRGTLIDALITSTLTYVALKWLIGLEAALPLAALMFIGEFVPYVGPFAAAVPAVLLALTHGVHLALWTALAYLVIQQIEGHILIPNIMRTEVEIPQWLVLMGVFVGGLLGGILGILAAIPLSGAAKVLAEESLAPAIRRWTGAAHSARSTDRET